MLRQRIACLVLLFCQTYHGTGQVLDSTVVRFIDYHVKTPFEKVYLRTDKEVYAHGEIMWISAYLVEAVNHQPSVLSELMYVELLNSGDSVISILPIKITDGIGKADFLFADSLSEGIYHLRGYTNYMRNFPLEFLFTKPVKLLDYSSRTVTKIAPPEVKDINIQFFPEGGDLINGLQNFVAFKAVDEWGKGVKVQGRIVDQEGLQVGVFEEKGGGMGKFQLKPQPGKDYFAVYQLAGAQFSKELPKARNEGHVFNVRHSTERIYLTVRCSSGSSIHDAFIVGHTRGNIFTVVRSTPGKPFLYAALNKLEIPSGIAHFTFFNGKGQPQAERLVFNHNPLLATSVKTSSSSKRIRRREEVTFQMEVRDAQENAVDGQVSVSVLHKELSAPNMINIQNYLLVSSDLKGVIETPWIYFDQEVDREDQLDLVMMTNGWRRFKWEDVIQRSLPEVRQYPEKGFSIEGTVTRYVNRSKPVKGKVELSLLGNTVVKQEATSKEDGTFWFDGLDIMDTVLAVIKTTRLKEGEDGYKEAKGGTYISLIERDHPTGTFQYQNPFYEDAAYEDYVDNSLRIRNIEAQFGDDVIVLDEVQVESRKDVFEDPFYQRTILYRNPDDRLVLDSLPGANNYTNIFNLIRGKFPGVQIMGTFPNQTAVIRGFNSIMLSNEAMFVVDGIPTDASLVAQIPPNQVAFIDVLKGSKAAIYSSSGNGVIAIYRYDGPRGMTEQPDPVSFISLTLNGYYPAREFYVPDYDNMTREESVRPDRRSTLYWQPSVEISKGEGTFDFYTSDDMGEFVIYYEGLTNDGRIILGSHLFEVN